MTTALTALVTDAYGGTGGMAQWNRHLLDALATDPRLTVSALGVIGDPSASGPPGVAWSIPRPGDKRRYALAALGAVARQRPSIVFSGHVRMGLVAHPLATLARARVWTATHGIEVWRGTPGLAQGELVREGRRLDDALLARSTLVTTVSRYTRARLLAWCPIDPARVEVLPNTLDRARYQPGPWPRDLAEKLGVDGAKVLLTVGRLHPDDRYKGHDRVIPLLPELERRFGKVRYVIAGSGSDRARLERVAAAAGASGQVVFAGYVPDAELPRYYRLADAFVMPSTGEGFGIVYLEAMACGCPVVAGNQDGSVDALADGALGRLVAPHDGRELREAIAATLTEGRGYDAPIRGLERFDLDRFRDRVRELVGGLLAR
jgi:phosphatidylinositol alpha-1,6-mannosyltransferase